MRYVGMRFVPCPRFYQSLRHGRVHRERCVHSLVADCLKPKYISKTFWSSLKARMPFACRDFAKFLAANVEVSALIVLLKFVSHD